MINKKYFYVSLFVIVVLCIMLANSHYDNGDKGDNDDSTENVSNDRFIIEDTVINGLNSENIEIGDSNETNNDNKEVTVIEENRNQTVSLFSWHFELTNQPQFSQLSKALEFLGVNRVYQNISARNIKEPEMAMLIQNLSAMGIETVALTGDKSWVQDGLDEYRNILQAIDQYNCNVPEEYQISKIALDVEVHQLQGWEKKKKKIFEKYVEMMKEAKEEANAYGLRVIQIIPTKYDDIDEALFLEFVKECCDEITIMNYDKKDADKAITYEVEICKQYNIPIETIFETMPISEAYGVTEEITYHYAGLESLKEDAEKLRETYGSTLGIGYHHFTTIYEMVTNCFMGEIYWEKEFIGDELDNPGNLYLYGSDGSILLATPYWSGGRRNKGDFCWLTTGVKGDVIYKVVYVNLYGTISLTEDAVFSSDDGVILKMVLGSDDEEN